MVTDRLENANLYFGLSKKIESALRFLRTDEASELPIGKHDIAEGIFAIASEYITKPRSACVWETHREYIDVQLIVEGCESIDYAPSSTLSEINRYDKENDCTLYSGEGSEIRLEPGSFAIFYPEDAHRPCVVNEISVPVRKVVVKVKID